MKFSNKYLVEALVFISYVLFAMAWVGGTASMSQIMATMEVESLASASFISGAVTIAKIVGTFMAAWLAIKVGIKYAFFISGLLVALGVFTPLAESYDVLLVSRFLMGLGGAFMIVYFNPIVMKWFDINERPTINGLNAVAFNIGTAIILSSMTSINLLTGGWQSSLVLFSVVSLGLCLLWLFVDFAHDEAKEGTPQNTSVPKNADVASKPGDTPEVALKAEEIVAPSYGYAEGFKDKFLWSYSLCYSGLLAFYICLFTFYPKAGISQSAIVIGFGIIGTLAGMIYSKKIKQRVPVIKWSGLVVTAMVFVLSFANNDLIQVIAAMILGFFIFFPITALVSIPHELKDMTGDKITVIFSLFWSISYLIATVVLWMFGRLVDVFSGDFTASFILIGLVSSSFFIGSFFLPETNKALPKVN